MANRTVTDDAGRAWTCTSTATEGGGGPTGRDLSLSCVTTSVSAPLHLIVGWQWETMSDNGLARMISQASPAPKASLR